VFHLLVDRSYGAWFGPRKKATQLVNASVVGGRHNEERREPIVVSI
jgi:hypothetical protein